MALVPATIIHQTDEGQVTINTTIDLTENEVREWAGLPPKDTPPSPAFTTAMAVIDTARVTTKLLTPTIGYADERRYVLDQLVVALDAYDAVLNGGAA